MVKIFLDTEFTGLHQKTTFISLAMVAETGEEFYAEFVDYDKEQVTEWHKDHVLSKCWLSNEQAFEKRENGIYLVGDSATIKQALQHWIAQFDLVEIWADVLAYDWVLFCELFGGAFYIPKNIFYAPFDLATLFRLKNLIEPIAAYDNDIKRFEFGNGNIDDQHNALADARVELSCFRKLMNEK